MTNEDLYKRIKNLDITEVSKSLFWQISRKGHTRHKIIGSIKQHMHLYGFSFGECDLPSHISYQQFKKEYPKIRRLLPALVLHAVQRRPAHHRVAAIPFAKGQRGPAGRTHLV